MVFMRNRPMIYMYDILQQISEDPPSDAVLDQSLVVKIRAFLKANPGNDETVLWNFLKELLDLIVHGGLAAPFFIRLFDLEATGMKAPPGGYAQADGSINNAPWRQPKTP